MIPTAEGPDGPSTPKQTKYSDPRSSDVHSSRSDADDSRPIEFKPLTEGLGFHLFADGLPYAPRGAGTPAQGHGSSAGTHSGTSTTGTGATAAGRPSFKYPKNPAASSGPTLSTSPGQSSDQAAERIRRELEAIRTQRHQPQATFPGGRPDVRVTNPNAAPPAALTKKLAELESYGFGYVLRRFFAYLIDFAFMGSICGSILSVALLNLSSQEVGYISLEALATAGVFLFGCIWAAIAAQEVAFGTSLGKRIFNLHLRGSGTDVFLRAVFFIPSLIFSGLGILMALADSKKRCWHDRVTQIQPENG